MTRKEAIALGRAARSANLRATAVARFWDKVKKEGPDDCWIWQGSLSLPGGYGMVSWHGTLKYAHRVALSLVDGDWDSPMLVCHSCDRPPCCNPKHLWRGTHLDNMLDKVGKGRLIVSGNSGRPGETNAASKLTVVQVQEIRMSKLSDKKLASHYGVSHGHIFRIRNRIAWSHV